jgi:hypothetical protein
MEGNVIIIIITLSCMFIIIFIKVYLLLYSMCLASISS